MRLIRTGERFVGERVSMRLLEIDDCGDEYLAWLNDPEINRFLETRWREQTMESIRDFVASMLASEDSYLFAILEGERHVGNIKLGPVHARHAYADVSYFIGARGAWGRGLATDAIKLATKIGFQRLGLHRVQAGLYASNIGSARALEKAGFVREGIFRGQLRRDAREPASWEDHVFYGILREEWKP